MKYLIFAALFSLACAVNPKNTQCASPAGHIDSIDIYPCEKNRVSACILKRNTSINIAIKFTAGVNTTQVKAIVHGLVSGSILQAIISLATKDHEPGLRFAGISENACRNNDVNKCDVVKGDHLTYTNSIFVDPIYPLLSLIIKFQIRDEHDKDMVCFTIPAEIQA